MTASSTLQYTGELDDKLRAKLQKKYNDLLTGVKNAGKVGGNSGWIYTAALDLLS